jgi:dipeptidyl aminopeptidase/acylaminoacyl peptidase
MFRVLSSFAVTCVLFCVITSAAFARDVVPQSVQILGPLPVPPATEEAVFPRGEHQAVPEILPGKNLPDPSVGFSLVPGSELRWREIPPGPDAVIEFSEDGIYWLAAVLHLDTRAEVEFQVDECTALYCDGQELESDGEDMFTSTLTLDAGWVTVYARVKGNTILKASVDEGISAEWCLQREIPLTRFADLAGMTRSGSLAVSDGGKVFVRKVSRREPDLSRLDALDSKGRLLAADLGGPQARPVAFLPKSETLLLRRAADEGTDLMLWDAAAGPMRTILRGEPALGFVKISPDGRHLLFSSTAAYEEDDPVDGNRRYVHLRERVTDFTPVPHLHLLDLETGARRVLTTAADRVLDDAVFSADGKAVYYGQTLPASERPWFQSEINRLDLITGEDETLTRFTGGWEVRPHGLAASPDGKSLIFLGPPEEVGGGRDEHNVYNKQVWSLDLDSLKFQRLTTGLNLAFDVGGGLPRFDSKGRLLVEVADGSYKRLARLDPREDWAAELMDMTGESMGALAVSPDGSSMLYTTSSTGEPLTLFSAETGGKSRLLEQYNTGEHGLRLWCEPVDASFTGPDGDTIDAWFYPPLQHKMGGDLVFGAPAQGQAPLIVYYYAGAVPTMRGFNGTHQFFAANGYGLLVVNPRGAYGYGDEFADHHAGDWGPRAAADIIAGTNYILDQHSWLDKDGIGIYGGSYGGFMTEYLVTTTDMYAAAVSMYGISDLATYWGQGAWGWTYGDMALAGATPWDDPQYFIDHSPLFHADKINTPLLLLHGADDANVKPGESDQLFTALSVLGRTVELVVFPDEGHGISGSWDNRVDHRTMILEWFNKFCREQPEAWTERWE